MSDRFRQRSVDSATEQEIKHEQAVVDRIYSRLNAAAESARSLAEEGHARARLGNEGGLVERDAMVFQAARRLATLNGAHDGLVFGRLDMRDGSSQYIGRVGLRDANREVLLIDWRAPAAAVFYQATAAAPDGVVRRRVLQSRGDQVVGLEDDLLDPSAAPPDMVVVGEGSLIAELTRSRDRSMHSIVATIQAEQDTAIRASSTGVTTITGGPGTGKTVVALHRAAYLLYTDRRRYEGGGVLVVGPNPVFMRYIERVLPSLGETSVSLRALGEVVDGISAARHDEPDVAAIKGSARMPHVLTRTVRGPAPHAPDSFTIFYRDDVLTLDEQMLGQIRAELLASGQRRNRIAPKVPEELLSRLWGQVRGERAFARGYDAFAAELLSNRRFTDFARSWWPLVDAVDVLEWLADPARLARDASGQLTDAEIERLDATIQPHNPSVEDVPLLDELRHLLGEVADDETEVDPLADLYDETFPELGGGTHDRRRTTMQRPLRSIDDDAYAHVLVDEAQDLSPLQWRMLGRRGRHATWTIVSDLAQSAWPRRSEAQVAQDAALGDKDRRTFRLSTNYRNSREIFGLAADLARVALPEADLPAAVRSTGVSPRLRIVSPETLESHVVATTRFLSEEVEGTIGVVVPRAYKNAVDRWLGGPDSDRVLVLEALDTKGLEFDGAVVVEPDAIVAESPRGMATLYVVLTRATSRLEVVETSSTWRPAPWRSREVDLRGNDSSP